MATRSQTEYIGTSFCIVRSGNKYSHKYLDLFPNAIVLTDDTTYSNYGQILVPLEYNLPTWWCKMELFAPHNKDLRPLVYVDLDSLIMGDISPLFRVKDKFMACKEWMPQGRGMQSSVMIIPKEVDHIWNDFYPNRERIINDYKGGDQQYLNKFEWEDINTKWPGMVGSYRLHNKEQPKNAIVTFHGHPKPHKADGWAKEEWLKRTSRSLG